MRNVRWLLLQEVSEALAALIVSLTAVRAEVVANPPRVVLQIYVAKLQPDPETPQASSDATSALHPLPDAMPAEVPDDMDASETLSLALPAGTNAMPAGTAASDMLPDAISARMPAGTPNSTDASETLSDADSHRPPAQRHAEHPGSLEAEPVRVELLVDRFYDVMCRTAEVLPASPFSILAYYPWPVNAAESCHRDRFQGSPGLKSQICVQPSVRRFCLNAVL